MPGFQNNQSSSRGGRGNRYDTPRHGRIPSLGGTQPVSPPQVQAHLAPGRRPPPVVHHDEEEVPNALQRWNGSSVNPFMRWAYAVRDARGNAPPSYNYDPDMNNVIFLSETIDEFDANPQLVHELILRIANPDLGHSSMDWIRANRALVDILLYRHYQRHGGLILPPMDPALQAMRAHEEAADAARAAGTELPHITFPSFGSAPDDNKQVKGGKGKSPSGGARGGPNP